MSELEQQLNEKDFRAWLARFEDGTQVGVPRDARSCPIANYLKLAHGYSRASVGEHLVLANGLEVKTPRWASTFVRRVDAFPLHHLITKREALEFLGEDKVPVI